MGKKRQRQHDPEMIQNGEVQSISPSNPKAAPFNQALKSPLMELRARMKAEEKRKEVLRKEEEAAARKKEQEKKKLKQGRSGEQNQGLSDEALFKLAMLDVTPLEKDIRGRVPPPPPRPANIVDEDMEALTQLCELVAGNGPFDMSCGDDFIEGHAPGVDERILKTLKNGGYCIQGTLDLHGLSRMEAKPLIEKFLYESRRLGKRCVLIIHGKGLNSKDHIPVLKESLQIWLCQGAIGRTVLAFCSALPSDGGVGAAYVLLRR